ncbi:MAG: TIGR03620 family F420-dependent LLM class oxidoreductase [Microbacteriaceae bacterium]|nr:TIGR03620 family F420-dependent LLM class oxidoreductase [Microbacteriaceae bacterium]
MSATLDAERARLRTVFGPYGVWRGRPGVPAGFAEEVEQLGFGSLWLGGSPAADLAAIEEILARTERLLVATGIVNVWTADAAQVADSFHRIDAVHPGRFILGVGPGHPERVEQAARPYGPLVEYLDVLEARGVPASRLALAALGDRVLALAGERTLGAHPYFVPPAHTVRARSVLGPSPLLVPEVRVAPEADAAAARDRLRAGMAPYFALANYRNNLLRLGCLDAELDAERDEAIDLVAVHGDAAGIRAGVDAHLAAGADHVLAQVVPASEDELLPDLRRVAAALGLAPGA